MVIVPSLYTVYLYSNAIIYYTNCEKQLPLSPEGADGAHNGGSGGKRGHKPGGNGKNALGHRENLFDGREEILLNEVLLMGSVGTEIHFINVGVLGSKGVMIHMHIIFLYPFEFMFVFRHIAVPLSAFRPEPLLKEVTPRLGMEEEG